MRSTTVAMGATGEPVPPMIGRGEQEIVAVQLVAHREDAVELGLVQLRES